MFVVSVVYASALMIKGFSERHLFIVKTAAWSWREKREGEDGWREGGEL